MAEAFAACTQPVCNIGKCLWARIATRINYARKLSKNRKVLCEKAYDLSLKRKDIVAEIERSNPQKIATNECDDWIGKVQEMENKVGTIQSELNEEKRCVGELCLDIFARIKLGKRVVNMIDDINELLDKSKFERGYLVDAPIATVENQPDPPSTLAESANRTLNMVMDKIQHKSTLKIGIWGMGGVGKTTILRLLNNTPEIARMFDFVIWVTVSKSQSRRMIQEEVGQRLSIEITKGESDDRVAMKLRQRLNGKKYLLLLDDVWNMVDLDAVGIPNPNQNNGCKFVLTTRKFEVCRQMETDVEIKVEVLPEEEAREMFYTNVGDVVRLPARPPNANIFTNLKDLSLRSCPVIKQVFSSGFMVQQLSNLEVLSVSTCGGLKGMIPEDEIVEHEALPKLRILSLNELPEFVSFFKGVPMRWQSLEKVEIRDCPKLRKLPFDTESAPNLNKIKSAGTDPDSSHIWWSPLESGVEDLWEEWDRSGRSMRWWRALEWDNDATRLRFQPLFTLVYP